MSRQNDIKGRPKNTIKATEKQPQQQQQKTHQKPIAQRESQQQKSQKTQQQRHNNNSQQQSKDQGKNNQRITLEANTRSRVKQTIQNKYQKRPINQEFI